MLSRLVWPLGATASIAGFAIVLEADIGTPWRPLAALTFLMVAPGASVVPLIGLRDRVAELALVVPLSVALITLTSAPLFYARLWSAKTELAILLGVCVVGVVLNGVGVHPLRRPM